jgi:hypothetical protein
MRHRIITNPLVGAVTSLRVGDRLEVRLGQVGGTGYAWTVASAPAVVQGGDESVHCTPPGHEPPLSAGPNLRTAVARSLRFRAVAPGSGVLHFELTGDEEDDAIASVELTVLVRAKRSAGIRLSGWRGTAAQEQGRRGPHRSLALHRATGQVVEKNSRAERALLERILRHRRQPERT